MEKIWNSGMIEKGIESKESVMDRDRSHALELSLILSRFRKWIQDEAKIQFNWGKERCEEVYISDDNLKKSLDVILSKINNDDSADPIESLKHSYTLMLKCLEEIGRVIEEMEKEDME